MPKKRKKTVKKKKKRTVKEGIAHIKAMWNNTFITITDLEGNVLVSYTPPKLGFKHTKKRTAYAVTQAAIAAAEAAKSRYGLETVRVYVNGPGMGRNPAIKGLASAGLKISMIVDVSKPQFGGIRRSKPPRK